MVRRFSQKKVTAFTLVELLVVIAILALLLSVIMPALHHAKLCAKQVVCASKMRQWTLATLAYASEHENAIPPFADVCVDSGGAHALNNETYYYNRLIPYLMEQYVTQWGMEEIRKCPMAKTYWGDTAVLIGVYYSKHSSDRAPFIYTNKLTGSTIVKMCDPFKTTSIRTPANYLMMLDAKRDQVFEPVHWSWNLDYDGDGMNDSHSGVAAGLGPYNFAKPKIHRGGCNVSLFDGHVEWIRYETFWEFGSDGYPVHSYWWNNNRP